MVKKCLMCGELFTAKKNTQRYCSKGCYREAATKRYYQANPEIIKNCLCCDKQFTTTRRNKIYCSKTCKVKYEGLKHHDLTRFGGNREKAMERDGYKCVICGATEDLGVHHKDFSGQTNKPNNELDNLMTVCKSCHTNIHIPRLNTTPHVTKQCECCGKEIRVSQARINDGRGKYCSEECANKAKEKKTTIICAHCGKEFQVTLSRLKRGKVKFCSMECRKAAGYAWTNK